LAPQPALTKGVRELLSYPVLTLQEQISQFRELLGDFVARLVAVPFVEINNKIVEDLKTVAELWDLHWISLTEPFGNGTAPVVLHLFLDPKTARWQQ
jgi:hypothetical protein